MLATSSPAWAQQVRGRLLDGQSRQPIVLGSVALVDTMFAVIDRTVSDQDGAFELTAAAAGSYLVVADRTGYRPAVDGILELGAGGSIEISFYLQPKPLEMEALRVRVDRQRVDTFLNDQGFYERSKSGLGYFISPDQIERRLPFTMQDLVRGIPNVRVSESIMGTTFSVRCGQATLWIDGIRVPSIDLPVEDIAAVEIYSGGASTPLQFGGTSETCGAVLIWTKHGGGRVG